MGIALFGAAAGGAGPTTPFRWVEPDATLSAGDLARMARGEVVVKPLSARDGQLGVFTATELRQSPDVFVEWIRQISQLQRSKAVTASGRFSDPPSLADLDGLQLDVRDIAAIRECRPGHCDLKLSAPEIDLLMRATHGGRDVNGAFRRVLLERLMAYRAGGLEAVPASAGRKGAVPPHAVFAALQANSPYIPRSEARLATWLGQPERASDLDVESFYYWSKEYYASGKAMIALTHVGVTRGRRGETTPDVSVAGKQIFASRYMNGMLTHITLSRDPATGVAYMTYTNRAQLDLLKGMLGGLVRSIINSRLRGDAASVLRTLRQRIESGPPKATGAIAPGS